MKKSLLVLSDIHATDVDPSTAGAPSYVSSFSAAATGRSDPIDELGVLVSSEGLTPNYLLCGGDITNRSASPSFSFAWNKLNQRPP
jgi:hypothetical protein